jgi:hypothetical protein
LIRVRRGDLEEAERAGLIGSDQSERLWQFLSARSAGAIARSRPRFTFTNVLYYLGGMIAIGAMSLFMTLGWERFGGFGVFAIASTYAAGAYFAAAQLERRDLTVPMGILATLALVLVPLATWGLQHALGLWPETRPYRDYHYWIDWRWLTLEAVTLLAGVGMLWRWRAPFLVLPLAVTLWYGWMDFGQFLFARGADAWSEAAWSYRQWYSLAFGASMLGGAFGVDLRSRGAKDYAFWLYLFGLMIFWCALSSLGSGELSGVVFYALLNTGLILLGALLVRRAFTVFGALGVAGALGKLSFDFFEDSWLFPIALSALGLTIVAAGVWWSRREEAIAQQLRAALPQNVRELLEARVAERAG